VILAASGTSTRRRVRPSRRVHSRTTPDRPHAARHDSPSMSPRASPTSASLSLPSSLEACRRTPNSRRWNGRTWASNPRACH